MIFSEANFHPAVVEQEFKRLLRVPADYNFAGPMADNAAWAKQWFAAHARPWFCARGFDSCVVAADTVQLAGATLHSRELARRFRHARTLIVVAASAGAEAEAETAARWAAEEPDRYYFLETYASAVVEALIAEARARLCARADGVGGVLLPHYCPGYPGWPVEEQIKLFTSLDAGGPLPGPLEVMTSGMLRPKKSQLALFAVAAAEDAVGEPADLIPCKYCAHLRCEFRREPYAIAS